MPEILSNSACALRGVVRNKMTFGLVGQLLMNCCMCISFAISSRLVMMLLFWSIMQSNGGVSRFLNTFVFYLFLVDFI